MLAPIDSSLFLTGVILLIAVIDDLRSRKIHNHLILFMFPFVLIAVFLLKGFVGLQEGSFSALLALLVVTPLALFRIVGGGDLKLIVLIAFSLHWSDLFKILIYSLFWSFILGIIKITLDKKLKQFFMNMFWLLKYRKAENLDLHSIPFSVAIFVSWLSWLTLQILG